MEGLRYLQAVPEPRAIPPGRLTEEVAAILNATFESTGIKQSELGQRSGISQSQVSKYLRGTRVPDIERLQQMCAALEVRMSDVVAAAEARIGVAPYRHPMDPSPANISERGDSVLPSKEADSERP